MVKNGDRRVDGGKNNSKKTDSIITNYIKKKRYVYEGKTFWFVSSDCRCAQSRIGHLIE